MSGFIVIPAIDIRGGRCVRLFQGDYDRETVFAGDPAEVARRWEAAGARLIHLVDLDGAREGRAVNRVVIERIVGAVTVPVEVGGGIRDRAAMDDYHALGVARVILGTRACREPESLAGMLAGYPGEVYVGLDARNGLVAVEGWRETLPTRASAVAAAAAAAGATGFIYTDISRDGTLEGPNLAAMEAFAKGIDRPVIASGGVSRLDDILALADLVDAGITGVIVGRALYAGGVDLAEAVRRADRVA